VSAGVCDIRFFQVHSGAILCASTAQSLDLYPQTTSIRRSCFFIRPTDTHPPTQQNQQYQTKPTPKNPTPDGAQVTAAEFSPDGSLLATGSLDCSIILWRVDTGRAAAIFVGDAAITTIAFAAGAAAAAAAARDDDGDTPSGDGRGDAGAPGGEGRGDGGAAGVHTLVVGDAAGDVHFLCGLPEGYAAAL